MRRYALVTLILVAAWCQPAASQTTFSSGYTGIYWNPELNGWGFSMDIQRGLMFVALFGYDNDGGEAFLTLISDRVSLTSPFTFSGDVFLTTENGTQTTDVGDFQWRIMRRDGQPSARIDLTSPFITLDDFLLVRFGYQDSDPLSPIAGRSWALGFVDDFDAPRLARIGDLLVIDSQRFDSDGLDVLAVSTLDQDVFGFAFFDEPSQLYVIALQDVTRPAGELMLLTFVTTHEVMSFGVADYVVGASTTESRAFVSVSASEEINVTKRRLSLPDDDGASLLMRAGRALKDRVNLESRPPMDSSTPSASR